MLEENQITAPAASRPTTSAAATPAILPRLTSAASPGGDMLMMKVYRARVTASRSTPLFLAARGLLRRHAVSRPS